jgi:hypothetical protein
VTAHMYRRPLSAISAQFRQVGFTIDLVDEPQPQAPTNADPKTLEVLHTQPVFLFVRAPRAS